MSMNLNRRSFLSAAAGLAAAAATRRLYADEPKPAGGRTMAAGTNAFAADLYGKLRGEKGDVFFSPFSVSAALAMTAAGAKGDTLAQMRKVLHMPDAGDGGLGEVLKAVSGQNDKKRGYELSVANAVWGQKGYPWRPEFLTTVRDRFAAEVRDADFKADPEAARRAVNTWVEERTKEKIKELLQSGTVDPMTRMVLANAVYFKGTWLYQFHKGATKDAPFTRADGTKKDVPLMNLTGQFTLRETDDRQVIELPYVGSEVSMVVVLPRKPDGLPAVEKAVAADSFAPPRERIAPQSVRVSLPRFKVERAYALNDPLTALGMAVAFDAVKADFGGMVTDKPEGPLYITHVAHKAFVDVNEEGTEAAGATGVVAGVRSAPADPKVFKADRPFLFAIRHNPTGAVLFLGRYDGPV